MFIAKGPGCLPSERHVTAALARSKAVFARQQGKPPQGVPAPRCGIPGPGQMSQGSACVLNIAPWSPEASRLGAPEGGAVVNVVGLGMPYKESI